MLIGLLIFPGISGAQSRHRRSQSEIQTCRFNNLSGLAVENHDGEKLGRLKNFAIDMQTGQAKYAIISSDGIVGIGAHLKVVPATAVSTATAKKDIASLEISKRRWAKAPIFKRADLANLNDPTRSQLISRFYAHSTDGAAARGHSQESEATPTAPPQTGQSAQQAKPSAPLQLASEIVGKSVANRQGEALGKISDLLIDPAAQKPSFAIISNGRLLQKQQTFAAPLRSLTFLDKNRLVLDANPKQFEDAEFFDDKTWAAASASNAGAIYKIDLR